MRMQNSDIGIIFDMDGVLIETEHLHFEAYRKLLELRGVNMTYRDFMPFIGIPARESIRRQFAFWGLPLNEPDIPALVAERERYYHDFARSRLKPFDGAEQLLSAVKASCFRMALATSGTRENVDFTMGITNFGKYFDAIVCASDIHRGKPDPEIFIKAAEKLKLGQDMCVVIEDSAAGVEAAVAAGMRCIAVTTTHNEDELSSADVVVDGVKSIGVGMLRGFFDG